MSDRHDHRRANLTAALGFLRIPPRAFAPEGFGVAETPWGAGQRAGWAAVGHAAD